MKPTKGGRIDASGALRNVKTKRKTSSFKELATKKREEGTRSPHGLPRRIRAYATCDRQKRIGEEAEE